MKQLKSVPVKKMSLFPLTNALHFSGRSSQDNKKRNRNRDVTIRKEERNHRGFGQYD